MTRHGNAENLEALHIQRLHPAIRRERLDVGAVHDTSIDGWAMGAVGLAQAPHQYGQPCLWRIGKATLSERLATGSRREATTAMVDPHEPVQLSARIRHRGSWMTVGR